MPVELLSLPQAIPVVADAMAFIVRGLGLRIAELQDSAAANLVVLSVPLPRLPCPRSFGTAPSATQESPADVMRWIVKATGTALQVGKNGPEANASSVVQARQGCVLGAAGILWIF